MDTIDNGELPGPMTIHPIDGPFTSPCGRAFDRYDDYVRHYHNCGECFFTDGDDAMTKDKTNHDDRD